MASSRPIVAGEDYTPDDINNLRNDVLDPVGGHKHNGTDGAKVPFSNLDVTTGTAGSAPPTGGSKSYNDIANHVVAKGIQNRLKTLYPDLNLLFLDCDAGNSEVNFFNRMHFFLHHARQFA